MAHYTKKEVILLKSKKRLIFIVSAVAIVTGIAISANYVKPILYTAVANTDTTTPTLQFTDLYSKETDYPLASSEAVVIRIQSNLSEMYASSDIVAEVIVKSQQVLPISDLSVQTLSDVTIVKSFKNVPNVTSVTVAEVGGPYDLSKVPEKYKQKPGSPDQRTSGIVEQTLEGSPTMKNGNTYVVFLKKGKNKDLYNLTGTFQGKIKLDTNKNIGVATVDEKKFNEKSFFLQKEFAGKSKKDIEQTILSLQ